MVHPMNEGDGGTSTNEEASKEEETAEWREGRKEKGGKDERRK